MTSTVEGWQTFYLHAAKYHKTVLGSVRRPEIFTPSLVENIAAMSIEKYFMAIFMHRGLLPRNHTMLDLFEEAGKFLSIPDSLGKNLTYMDSLQRICSLEAYSIIPPSTSDVPRFLETVEAVAALARAELGPSPLAA